LSLVVNVSANKTVVQGLGEKEPPDPETQPRFCR